MDHARRPGRFASTCPNAVAPMVDAPDLASYDQPGSWAETEGAPTVETSAPPATLAARAVAAFQAAELERAVAAEAEADAGRERMVARARKLAANAFAVDTDPKVTTLAGRETVIVEVGGAWLVADTMPRSGLRGLRLCPECGTWNCRTVAWVETLEWLGQLIDAPESMPLMEHEAPDGLICDGRARWLPPRPVQQWIVRPVLHIADIETALNELDAAGYRPQVVYDRTGNSLVVGHARHMVERDDDDPF